jgi:hypothetical protein
VTILSVLALTHFKFQGVSKYLEDLVARIDVPQLNLLRIYFFSKVPQALRASIFLSHVEEEHLSIHVLDSNEPDPALKCQCPLCTLVVIPFSSPSLQ